MSNNTRISKVTVSHFRGIPNRRSLSFRHSKTNNAVSLILTGDNGTGKSSFVDALEFGLQGLIGVTEESSHARRSLISLMSTDLPSIEVTLSDGSRVSRRVVRDESDGLLYIDSLNPHTSFMVSPIVLRRKDILRFQDVPEAQRILVFSNYLRSNTHRPFQEEHPDQTLKRLSDERLSARERRDSLRLAIANILDVNPDEVPLDPKACREFINDYHYGGLSPSKFAKLTRRGFRVNVGRKLPRQRLERLGREFEDPSRRHRKLKAHLREYELSDDDTRKRSFPRHLLSSINEFLGAVGPRLSQSFRKISSSDFVEEVDLSFGDLGALVLRIRLRIVNGKVCAPRDVLSEANLDLLALLFFVAIAQESAKRGQARIIVLDDVLQSVDSTVRVEFMSYLLQEMSDWQIFITVHDRMWREQVRNLFVRLGHHHTEKAIHDWSFETGPILKDGTIHFSRDLAESIRSGSTTQIAWSAGHTLERMCDNLSHTLPISIKRRRDDKYTLGDLWPGVRKILRKTECQQLVDLVDRHVDLRNLLGAHPNEWAAAASRTEVRVFGDSVLALVDTVYCADCREWIVMRKANFWTCRCEKRTLTRGR